MTEQREDQDREPPTPRSGYTAAAVLSSLIGTAGNVVTVGLLRGGAWAARGLRVPAHNALLADVVPASAYGRAYGFERTMDDLGAMVGSLFAFGLVAVFSVRAAILISVIPGLLAALAIVYAIHQARLPAARERHPVDVRANVSSHVRVDAPNWCGRPGGGIVRKRRSLNARYAAEECIPWHR